MQAAFSTLLAAALVIHVAVCPSRAAGRGVAAFRAQDAPPPPGRLKAEGGTFRGQVGDRQVELRLKRDGERVTGTYSYDGIGQPLKLEGRIDARGQLTLAEFDAGGKQTGKFVCGTDVEAGEPALTFSGNWSRPDGRGETYVVFSEQHDAFTNGLRVVSRVVRDRKYEVRASYPQLAGGDKALADAVSKFNRQVEALVQKQVREFVSLQPPPGRSSYAANYNVLLGSDRLVSVEIVEDSYAGGAHPNTAYFTLNYDLRAGREVALEELFKHNSAYGATIIKYSLDAMNRRARQLEEENARREGRKAEPRDEPLFSAEGVTDWDAWAMTPQGLVFYFDLPHAVAAFSRNFVPYRVLRDALDAGGPAAPYLR